ncbi:MAG: DMT family transporter [Alistipes sp.]
MNKIKPHLALLFCNMVWAMDYPFYNYVMPHYVEPRAMITASLCVTALISLLPLLWEKMERVAREDIWKLIGAALLIGVLRKVFMMYGLSQTSPIDGSIIATIVPLLVLIISVIIGIDHFTKLKVAGLILGMGGAVGVIVVGASVSHAHSNLLGNILIFICAATTALYMVWFKKLITKYRITTLLRWIYCVSAVAMLPFGIKEVVQTDYAVFDWRVILAVLFVLTLPTYLPNLLLNYALKSVQPTVSSIYTYLQPILAVTLSVWMGLDKLQFDMLLFGLVIFVGIALVLLSYRRQAALSVSSVHFIRAE